MRTRVMETFLLEEKSRMAGCREDDRRGRPSVDAAVVVLLAFGVSVYGDPGDRFEVWL